MLNELICKYFVRVSFIMSEIHAGRKPIMLVLSWRGANYELQIERSSTFKVIMQCIFAKQGSRPIPPPKKYVFSPKTEKKSHLKSLEINI
jgi:hypothetical protein